MRTIIFMLMLTLTLVACGGKNDAPDNAGDADNATETAALPTTDEGLGDSILNVQFEPIGEVTLSNGTNIPIVEFKKLGKYYLYIDGKLNGRASTVISLTRLPDMQRWAGVAFQDPNNFVIITKDQKQLHFTDSRIFMGSDSHDSFAFITSGDNYTTSTVEVKKADVATIKFSLPKPSQ